jgi:hypothetical protein
MSSPTLVRMKVQLVASGVSSQPGDVLTLPNALARAWVALSYCEIIDSPVEPEGGGVEAATLLPAAETTARPAARKRKK